MTGTRIRAALSLGAKVTAGSSLTAPHHQHLSHSSYSRYAGRPVQLSCTTGFSTPLVHNARCFSTQKISKNLHFMTPEDEKPEVDSKSLIVKRKDGTDRPLVVLLEWMAAKRKHVTKFTDLYLGSGYDVLVAPLSPKQLLFPVSGGQVLAAEVAQFLVNNQHYSRILVHGFSIGGYVWGEIELLFSRDAARYSPVIERIQGQVWDSIVGLETFVKGFPLGVYPNNFIARTAFEKYLGFHLYMFSNVATKHYQNSSECFKRAPVRVPALLLLSRSDPICSFKENIEVKEKWSEGGTPVSIKIWDESPHVGHLRKHRTEYIQELNKFLQSINLPTVQDTETGHLASKL